MQSANRHPIEEPRYALAALIDLRRQMLGRGTIFQPELIELMKTVLEEATESLRDAKRTSATKADMASAILACAARGERNPVALKVAALSAIVLRSRYSHDISPERRTV